MEQFVNEKSINILLEAGTIACQPWLKHNLSGKACEIHEIA